MLKRRYDIKHFQNKSFWKSLQQTTIFVTTRLVFGVLLVGTIVCLVVAAQGYVPNNSITKAADQQKKDEVMAIHHLIDEGHRQRREGARTAAQRSYELAIQQAETIEYVPGIAHATAGLAHLARIQRKFSKAESYYHEAFELYRTVSSRSGQARALAGLGHLHRMTGNLSEAERLYKQAQKLFEQEANVAGVAHMLKTRGDYALRLGNVDQARTHYEQSLELCEQSNNRQGKANVLSSLADFHRLLGDETKPELLNQAEVEYRQAKEIYETLSPPVHQGIAQTLAGLGHLARKKGRNDETQDYYREAQVLYAKVKDFSGEAEVLISWAYLEVRLQKYEEAQQHYKRSSYLYEQLNDPIGISSVHVGIGDLYRFQKDLELAKKAYTTALAIYRNLGLQEEISQMDEILERIKDEEVNPNHHTG